MSILAQLGMAPRHLVENHLADAVSFPRVERVREKGYREKEYGGKREIESYIDLKICNELLEHEACQRNKFRQIRFDWVRLG